MRRLLRVVGAVLLVSGFGIGLFVAYRMLGTGAETAQAQRELQAQWEGRPDPTDRQEASSGSSAKQRPRPPGRGAIGVLYAPRLGDSWSWVVVEGVSEQDLKRGPGHYPDSALPGERGNFAVAGHRATYGEPFAYLDRLRPGDQVLVETRTEWHVYRVRRVQVTGPDRTDLVADVPGRPGAPPNGSYLTLTTCHPRWGDEERLVVTAELARSLPYDQGPPPGVRP